MLGYHHGRESRTTGRYERGFEAQALAEALLDAETRIGELTREIPERRGGDRRSDDFKTGSVEPFETKRDTIGRLGLNDMQVKRFETLAAHPDVVEQVKADARENDDLLPAARLQTCELP